MNTRIPAHLAASKSLAWLAMVCLVITLLLASACANLRQSVETPQIALTAVKLVEAGLSKQRYELVLHVKNPNSIAIPVRGLSYRVQLAGERFASGESVQAFTVPANGETEFELSVTTDLLRTLSSLQRMLSDGEQTLKYELGGQLKVNLPFIAALPFSSAGEVDLTRPLRY